MNRTMKRMALPIGAALILGSSGFAYMASNAVDHTSLGQGSAPVTGYAVTDITHESQQGWGKPDPIFSTSATKFILTSDSNIAPANERPTTVHSALTGAGGAVLAEDDCEVTSWTINGGGFGTGAVVCRYDAPPAASAVTGLDVFATQ